MEDSHQSLRVRGRGLTYLRVPVCEGGLSVWNDGSTLIRNRRLKSTAVLCSSRRSRREQSNQAERLGPKMRCEIRLSHTASKKRIQRKLVGNARCVASLKLKAFILI